MREFRPYLIFTVGLLLLYVIYKQLQSPEVHWNVTYKVHDKSPFGLYILQDRSEDVTRGFTDTYQTISQMDQRKNILILAQKFEIESTDYLRMTELLKAGRSVLIGADYFGRMFKDSLGVRSEFNYAAYGESILEAAEDQLMMNGKFYRYPTQLLTNYFRLDSASGWEILARTEKGPVVIRRKVGEANLVLTSVPLVFTNFGLLYNSNHQVASELLTNLYDAPVLFSQFYQSGRKEASTPLRYFLSKPSLRLSVYVAMFAILVFIIIMPWRKQRAIPVIEPPANASVQYAQTLGGLFHREGNHYKAALKLIHHFYAEIRERFWLEPSFDEKFYQQLAGKTGVELEQIRATFRLIESVRKSPALKEAQLVELSQKIDLFKQL